MNRLLPQAMNRAAFTPSITSIGFKSASILLLCETPMRCHRGDSSESEFTLSS